MHLIYHILLASVVATIATQLSAEVTPDSLETDQRIRTVTYSENNVVILNTSFEIATLVQLGDDEYLDPSFPFLIGSPSKWDIHPFGVNGFYVKPIKADGDTNLTVRTTKRTYFFLIKVSEDKATTAEDTNIAVTFDYPQIRYTEKIMKQLELHEREQNNNDTYVVESGHPTDVTEMHFDYDIRGYKPLQPESVFDYGGQVYFQFKDQQPVIYGLVDGKETLLNHIVKNNWIIVTRASDEFILVRDKKRASVKRNPSE